MFRTPFDFPHLVPPGLPVPDLEVVVDAGDNDVAAEFPVVDARRGHHDPSLLVRLELCCSWEEVARDLRVVAAERIEWAGPRFDEPLPFLTRVDVKAA